MAKDHLERKKSGSAWTWILAVAVLALLGWGVAEAFEAEDAGMADGETTEAVEMEAGAESSEAAAPALTLEAILGNPQGYVGEPFPTDVFEVGQRITDRGFWITREGNQLMAILIDRPQEEPADINPGARVRLMGGTLRAPSELSDIPGVPLDQDTRTMAGAQEVVVVVDEANVDIVEPAGGG